MSIWIEHTKTESSRAQMFVSHNVDELFRSNMTKTQPYCITGVNLRYSPQKKMEEKMAFQVGKSFYMS